MVDATVATTEYGMVEKMDVWMVVRLAALKVAQMGV